MIVLLATFGLGWAFWLRLGRPRDLDGTVFVALLTLSAIGLVSTGAALFDAFTAPTLAATTGGLAILLVLPWRRDNRARHGGNVAVDRPRIQNRGSKQAWGLVLAVALGVVVRWPPLTAELAGQDQATYVLRARHAIASGSLHATDNVLAEYGPREHEHAGAADLLGLYPANDRPELVGYYEAAYRPGAYLADRQRGKVVFQFLHVHPMLLAATGLVVGAPHVHWLLAVEALLALLAFAGCARRLFGSGSWALTATLAYALCPLAIWVHRTPLSETLFGALWWGALLAVLRGCDEARSNTAASTPSVDPSWAAIAACLLGMSAWVRGDAWLIMPGLALFWWTRRHVAGARSFALAVGLSIASVIVHAYSSFPYVFDELRRRVTISPTPPTLAVLAILAGSIWMVVDRWLQRQRSTNPPATSRRIGWAAIPLVAAAVLLGRTVLDAWSDPTAPYSRLSPAWLMFGAAIYIGALVGLLVLSRRARAPRTLADTWWWSLAIWAVLTELLFAPRSLPHAGLYYYARYLVPVLLPAAIVCAVVGFQVVFARSWRGAWERHRRWVTHTAQLGVVASVAYPLLVTPTSRLHEYQDLEHALEWLRARIEPNAVIVAGGEGWLADHAFNQVGGALAIGSDITVLPYHDREAAYASLLALVDDETQPHRPVYLLLNEATRSIVDASTVDVHADPAPSKPRTLTVLDDRLSPPLRARSVELLEIVTHRLTPVVDERPGRITRLELRMALARIVRDDHGVSELSMQGGLEHGVRRCFDADRPLTITLPPATSPRSLVLVAAPGHATANVQWRITARAAATDTAKRSVTRPLALDAPGRTPRPRDTLGPFALEPDESVIEIVGSVDANPNDRECPHGGIVRVELLAADGSLFVPQRPADTDHQSSPRASAERSEIPSISAYTLAPIDLDQPIEPTTWVRGVALSRFRPGTAPRFAVEGRTLVLEPGKPLRFAPIQLPARATELAVLATVMHARLDPAARLVVTADGQPIARIDPPDVVDNTWQSSRVPWRPSDPLAQVTVSLDSPSPHDRLELRDVVLLDPQVQVTSQRVSFSRHRSRHRRADFASTRSPNLTRAPWDHD